MKATSKGTPKAQLLFFLLLPSVLFSSFAFAKVEAVLGKIAIKDNPNIFSDIPTSDDSEILVSRDQYLISYNKDRRNPNWVAWKLEADQMGTVGRSNNFLQDPDLEKYLVKTGAGHAVDSTEYSGSCLDRGHQAPSADRTDTLPNNQATFLMSNMIPQTPYLNRVVWEHLESHTRDLVRRNSKKVYIFAGPIYDEDFGMIGPRRDIKVPSKNFKIIVVMDANLDGAAASPTEVISVVMPNTLEDGSKPNINQGLSCGTFRDPSVTDLNDWQKYQTTVSEVERLSGLHFSFK
jgi:endonuclease G